MHPPHGFPQPQSQRCGGGGLRARPSAAAGLLPRIPFRPSPAHPGSASRPGARGRRAPRHAKGLPAAPDGPALLGLAGAPPAAARSGTRRARFPRSGRPRTRGPGGAAGPRFLRRDPRRLARLRIADRPAALGRSGSARAALAARFSRRRAYALPAGPGDGAQHSNHLGIAPNALLQLEYELSRGTPYRAGLALPRPAGCP